MTDNDAEKDRKDQITPAGSSSNSSAAQRALAEAEARQAAKPAPNRPKELGGRKGPEPTRYGDWERDGIVSDF